MKSGRHSKGLSWVVPREGHSFLSNGGVQRTDQVIAEQVDAP